VAVARQHKTARITAIDVSPAALEVAARNAAKHNLAERIRFLQGDVYSPLAADEQFDFILSNPPYIKHADLATLPAGVRDYEPHVALDGGADGFAVFDRLLAGVPAHLKPGGYLIVEIGSAQEAPARERIGKVEGLELAKTIHDGAGHPRVLRARWQPRM
jgi:release factor glutamine methyltransferase